MVIYDTCIIGAGPAGISLGTMLENSGKKIGIFESNKNLGGCWTIDWNNDKYFTEHSPKIITNKYNKFNKLCNFLGTKNKYVKTYDNRSSLFTIFLNKRIVSQFTVNDIIKIISALILSNFFENKLTVEEFSEHLSSKASKILSIISIALASTPDKVMMHDIFKETMKIPPEILQLNNPEEWIKKAERFFIESNNIDLYKNITIKNIDISPDNMYVLNNNIHCKELLICIPPKALIDLLSNSCEAIRGNWLPFSDLQRLALNSCYHSIGFQLHFDKKFETSKSWCDSCFTEWNIITIHTSEYVKEFSKDERVVNVISGTLIDQNKFSTRLKKKVKDCNLTEIKEEILYQLKLPYDPINITFYDGLLHNGKSYESKDTGFIRNKYGTIEQKGKLNNIYIVGPINHSGIITMENAIDEAYNFVKTNYKGKEKILNSHKKISLNFLILIILTLILIFKLSKII